MNSPPNRLYSVDLLESEQVVPYGVAKRTWFVNVEGRFTPAHKVLGAQIERRQSERGVVWSRTITLQLAAGTRLELVQESPRPRGRADTFSILTLDQKSATVRRRTVHEVTVGGRIALVK